MIDLNEHEKRTLILLDTFGQALIKPEAPADVAARYAVLTGLGLVREVKRDRNGRWYTLTDEGRKYLPQDPPTHTPPFVNYTVKRK